MNRMVKRITWLGGVFGVVAAAGMAMAAPPAGSSQDWLPVGQLIEKLEKDFDGRVTDVELEREFTGDVYEVELVDSKHQEWDIEVDAHTGEIVRKHVDMD
jgi:uncharacterized membrane protein YkoI